MEKRDVICASLVVSGFSLAIIGALAVNHVKATARSPCAADEIYLLAANSGALVRLESPNAVRPVHTEIVFREPADERRGWASRQLVRRFDLKLPQTGAAIANSGAYCSEG